MHPARGDEAQAVDRPVQRHGRQQRVGVDRAARRTPPPPPRSRPRSAPRIGSRPQIPPPSRSPTAAFASCMTRLGRMCQNPNSRLDSQHRLPGRAASRAAAPGRRPRKASSSNSTVPSGTLTRVLYSSVRGPSTARSSARKRRVKRHGSADDVDSGHGTDAPGRPDETPDPAGRPEPDVGQRHPRAVADPDDRGRCR